MVLVSLPGMLESLPDSLLPLYSLSPCPPRLGWEIILDSRDGRGRRLREGNVFVDGMFLRILHPAVLSGAPWGLGLFSGVIVAVVVEIKDPSTGWETGEEKVGEEDEDSGW